MVVFGFELYKIFATSLISKMMLTKTQAHNTYQLLELNTFIWFIGVNPHGKKNPKNKTKQNKKQTDKKQTTTTTTKQTNKQINKTKQDKKQTDKQKTNNNNNKQTNKQNKTKERTNK